MSSSLDAWQQFIKETDGIGGDGFNPLSYGQSVRQRQELAFPVMVCLQSHKDGFSLFVPDGLPNKERLIAGLSKLEWITFDSPLFLFPAKMLQKMIYLTSNYDVRWGIPRHYLQKGD